MTIIVMNMKNISLGTGRGAINQREGTAVIEEWNERAGVQVGESYKLKSDGKIWIAKCTENTLPVKFKLDLQRSALETTSVTGVKYTVHFRNQSINPGYACVYQVDPELPSNMFSLAWFSKYAFPTTDVEFEWEINYNFVWSQTGELKPGIRFTASQTWTAEPGSANLVTLDYDPIVDAYTFKDLTKGPEENSLYIKQSSTIPLNQISVGIGMSGKGTFVCQAQSNRNEVFTPHPKYWIAFGNLRQGEVLDQQTINNPAEVAFPPGVTSMVATLNKDNSWSIEPLQAANARFLAAREDAAQRA